jgi:molybdopterin molybdotransferase
MSMISVAEAIGRLRATSRVLVGSESCRLKAANGRVLAEDVVAGINVPPADNSAMDGYALRHKDWNSPDQALPISQRITAGKPPEPLKAGSAARIFTGAEIPEGADTVVMQENCSSDGDTVFIRQLGAVGNNIRPKGQDIERGATVLKAGHRLRPQDIGLIASLGFPEVLVWQRLTVALVSTGSELVEPGGPILPGQIYNSNHYMLDALLRGWGFEVADFGITEDDPAVLAEVMAKASEETDVIITTGGVSVGEEDHVKAVVESLGHLDLWRVAIKPGKPFAFGGVKATPFLGLPGNPVSAWVTLLVLGREFLLDCQGVNVEDIVPVKQQAQFSQKACGREVYIRVRSSEAGAEIFSQQSSGALFSTSWGNAFVMQKPDEDIFSGGVVNVIPFSSIT